LIELVQSFLNFFAPWFGIATIGLTILTLIVAFTDDGEREWPGIVFLCSWAVWFLFLFGSLTARFFLWLSGYNVPDVPDPFVPFWVSIATIVGVITVLVLALVLPALYRRHHRIHEREIKEVGDNKSEQKIASLDGKKTSNSKRKDEWLHLGAGIVAFGAFLAIYLVGASYPNGPSWWTGTGPNWAWMVFVFCLVALAFVYFVAVFLLGSLFYLRWKPYRRQAERQFSSGELRKELTKEKPWRDHTGIGVIERLKRELEVTEERVREHRINEVAFSLAQNNLNGKSFFKFWWWAFRRRHLVEHSSDYDIAGNYRGLEAKIDRFWRGNVYVEIGQREDEIKKLKREKEDYTDKELIRTLDERVIDLDRELSDLQELKRRAEDKEAENMKLREARFKQHRHGREIDIRDEMHDEIQERFRPALTQIETAKLRDELIKKVQDLSLSSDEQNQLIEEIKNAAKKQPSSEQPNIISIFKKEY